MTAIKMVVMMVAVVAAVAGTAAADDGATHLDPHDQCVQAMSNDPGLAKTIGDTAFGVDVAAKRRADLDKEAGERREKQDADQREQTTRQIALDQRQVILAYAAMWVVAAGFLAFMWRKQGALRAEIASLRRELEDAARQAAKDAKGASGS
jgi:hypothetical protein